MNNTILFCIRGLVQGIGYRPFVAKKAKELNITGWVKNTSGIVTVMATGQIKALEAFKSALESGLDCARVDSIETMECEPCEFETFTIEQSDTKKEWEIPVIPVDLPTCSACREELRDKNNARFRHPFISCTACGPRYSIIERLPYDRDNITMKKYSMCSFCGKEYVEPDNVRRHAQTIACKQCGPQLIYSDSNEELYADEAFARASKILAEGKVLAVKGIGGYQLTCRPEVGEAVRLIRQIKKRESKPLAMVFNTVDQIRELCEVDIKEEQELLSTHSPIVLLKSKGNHSFAKEVNGKSPYIGAMIASNPLYIMLVDELGPLVMTSANVTGDLMITDDEKMLEFARQADIPVLYNDRPILTPLDDSIVQIAGGRRQVIRRSRGFVPESIEVDIKGDYLAFGSDLKSTFAYVTGGKAYLSQNFGDYEDIAVSDEYQKELKRVKQLFGFGAYTTVGDKHPLYESSRAAEKRVFHHYAHVASVIAEKMLTGNILGVAMDGTGLGEDGNVWGSEFISFNDDIRKLGSLKPVTLIGGNEGARNCETILYGYLAQQDCLDAIDGINHLSADKAKLSRAAINHNINTIKSSSMGRLFDAGAAAMGICMYNTYEGQAPIEMEYTAALADKEYKMTIPVERTEDGVFGDGVELLLQTIAAVKSGVRISEIALGFINAVSRFTVDMINIIATGTTVALSGGTFANRILLNDIIERLERQSYNVYINELVPCGDGGLALGQAWIAEHYGTINS